jgi:histidine phosphotransfer protein HptB
MSNPALPATPTPLPLGPNFTPLDADALTRLRELDPDGKHGVLPRVLAAFEASLVRFMGQLQAQFDLPNSASTSVVSGVAHTLKSSSASVGALALSAACANTEARLRLNPNAELAPEITSLLGHAEAALTAVRAMLER